MHNVSQMFLNIIILFFGLISNIIILDFSLIFQFYEMQIRENPFCYKGKPRLKTGRELLRVSLEIEQRLPEVIN